MVAAIGGEDGNMPGGDDDLLAALPFLEEEDGRGGAVGGDAGEEGADLRGKARGPGGEARAISFGFGLESAIFPGFASVFAILMGEDFGEGGIARTPALGWLSPWCRRPW